MIYNNIDTTWKKAGNFIIVSKAAKDQRRKLCLDKTRKIKKTVQVKCR